MTVTPVLCFISTLIAAGTVIASDWRYQEQKHWSSQCKAGKLQSPIPLSLSTAVEKEFHRFRLKNYGQTMGANLKNNGHSAEVRPNITEENRPEISGGGLYGSYQLDHLHFHWQSEHTIEGRRFPLELHLVHYKKGTQNVPTALRQHHGVAVFAVLFELSPDDDEEFEPLLNIIESLQTQINKATYLHHINVKNFLPRDVAGFYRYDGSLTTPDCNEGILWTVFTNTIPISAHQVRVFEHMKSGHNEILSQNYRELQPLNNRNIYVKISPIRNSDSSATTATTTMWLFFISLFTFCFMK